MQQQIIQRIKELEDKHGRLTPEIVVADAKNTDSPLHGEFEWDVKKAAHEHWLDRARALIRSVKVVITTESRVVRSVAYVRDPSAPASDQGYVSVVKLRDDRQMAHEALVAEFGRAASALRRAHDLAAALNLENEVADLRERVERLQSDIEARVAH